MISDGRFLGTIPRRPATASARRRSLVREDLVEAFLYARPGGRFCSRCIGREIGLTAIEAFTAANTARIHRRHLHVDFSACTGCGTTKGVFWSE